MDTVRELMARTHEVTKCVHSSLTEQLMRDKATMLREANEAFADLRAMFDWRTEEQASRAWTAASFWRLRYPSKRGERHDPA